MWSNLKLKWHIFRLKSCVITDRQRNLAHLRAISHCLQLPWGAAVMLAATVPATSAQLLPKVSTKDYTVILQRAAHYGSRALVTHLIQQGAVLTAVPGLLEAAIVSEYTAMVKLLLKHKIPVFPGAVHLAAVGHDAYIVQALRKAGANMHEKNELGQTALHKAVAEGLSASVVKYLAKYCQLNAKNAQGVTALYYCAEIAARGQQTGKEAATLNELFVECLLDTDGIKVQNIGPESLFALYNQRGSWKNKILKNLKKLAALERDSDSQSYYSEGDSVVVIQEPNVVQFRGAHMIPPECWEVPMRMPLPIAGEGDYSGSKAAVT